MNFWIYATILGLFAYWVMYRMLVPKKKVYAARDFIRAEQMEQREREISQRSTVHSWVYPLYERIQQGFPTSDQQTKHLQQLIKESGEFDTTVEDIQIAQLTNVLLYPIVISAFGFVFMREFSIYFILFGLLFGFIMYRQPISVLKSKKKIHDQKVLEEMTRLTTIFMMLSSGNKTTYDAIVETVQQTKDYSKHLGYYLYGLEKDLYTRPTEIALRRFSAELQRYPFVDRFVNNVILALQKGGIDNNLNLRLRETLNTMDDDAISKKIERLKIESRMPTFISVFLMLIYFLAFGAAVLMMF
ncbi:hypothetical protein M3202_21290 [Alkalihalobacillus oceani]|uniref:Uncharacterized protein n=1 Tax=Halalkalibacter oceani TaxID=1653776 RepID=A0A9X2DUD2_9BACI|nr:hypothetical protein [Halalkalibacter oceani]MCM3716582.1 hypothetical protein [Halalkalibacter oceani]